MCGILGAVDPAGVDIRAMIRSLHNLGHRGPDNTAWKIEENGKLYLGHVRLKVIDVSDASNQPMVSPCGRYVLIYNGEIYNYKELRKLLPDDWHWKTSGDSETLLALYIKYGRNALDYLVGMFSFCIFDREKKSIFIARDRFGIKPLYYALVKDVLIFSSEIPPLLKALGSAREDKRMIRTYLESGLYEFNDHTFFEGVKSLGAGCWMEMNLYTGSIVKDRWYHLENNIPDLSGMGERDLIEATEQKVRQAINDHLIADVDVGLNVSGGIDSSVLVRFTVDRKGKTHLFTQDYSGYSEEEWVREISSGGNLHILRLSQMDIDSVLKDVVRSQSEPFGGVFVCGYHYIYKAADDESITVLLDGNGVDECFLGYKKYHQLYVNFEKERNLHEQKRNDYRAFWGEEPLRIDSGASMLAIDGTRSTCGSTLSKKLTNDIEPYAIPEIKFFEDPLKNIAGTDLLHTKIPRGLRFNDRISMAQSKELRVPYLDHRLVEFAFGIPTEYLLNKAGTKAVFRKMAVRHMSDRVAYAVKRSVQTPQREWLANEWSDMVTGILESESFQDRGWVDNKLAKQAYEQYCTGEKANSFFIWQWINLELWARAYLDSNKEAA